MINSKTLQNCYNDLYVQFRKYFWPFSTVKLLSDLEESIYQRFPNLEEINRILRNLKLEIHTMFSEDKDLQKAFQDLEDLVDSEESVFSKIESVNEVIPHENK